MVREEHCLPTNYQNSGVKSLNSTSVQSFVHVITQVIELQEHACPILMYGPKLFFCGFPKKGDVYINFTMPIVCVSSKSII